MCRWCCADEPCDLMEAYGFECPGEISDDNPDGCPDYDEYEDDDAD